MGFYKSQQLPEDELIVLPVPNPAHFAGCVIQLSQSFVEIVVTARLRTTISCSPENAQSIDQNCLQPPAKGSGMSSVIESSDKGLPSSS